MALRAQRPALVPVRLATMQQVDRLARTVDRLLGLVEQQSQEIAAQRTRLAQLQAEVESTKRTNR